MLPEALKPNLLAGHAGGLQEMGTAVPRGLLTRSFLSGEYSDQDGTDGIAWESHRARFLWEGKT